jgi:hypothetical protein
LLASSGGQNPGRRIMDTTVLLDEMVDIALMKREIWQTNLLAKIPLEPEPVRLGCIRILAWLRMQSVAWKIKPIELNPSSSLDQSCALLIEEDKDYFGSLFNITDGFLSFSNNLEYEQACDLMLQAKEKYNPPVIE